MFFRIAISFQVVNNASFFASSSCSRRGTTFGAVHKVLTTALLLCARLCEWKSKYLLWRHRSANIIKTYKPLYWLTDLCNFKIPSFRTETPCEWNRKFCQECETLCRVCKQPRSGRKRTDCFVWPGLTLHLPTDRHGFRYHSEKTEGIWWLEKSHTAHQGPNPGPTLLSPTQQLFPIWGNPIQSGVRLCHGISS